MGTLLLNKPQEMKYILIYNVLLRDKIIRYNFNISNIGNGYGGREENFITKIHITHYTTMLVMDNYNLDLFLF